MSKFTKLHLTHEISEFFLCFYNSCEIWYSLSRTPMRNFLWCYYRWLLISLALAKCKKECNILKIILVQVTMKVFFHWELILLNFLVASVFIVSKELKHQTFLVPGTPTGSICAAWQPLRISRRSWAAVTDFKTRVLRLKPEVQKREYEHS